MGTVRSQGIVVKYNFRVIRTARGWIGQVRKRVGDLTFRWWESRPAKKEHQAKRAAQRAIKAGEAVDRDPQPAREAWERMVTRYPRLEWRTNDWETTTQEVPVQTMAEVVQQPREAAL